MLVGIADSNIPKEKEIWSTARWMVFFLVMEQVVHTQHFNI